jgi:glycosyltransferase involved in cell wall biosynthesis
MNKSFEAYEEKSIPEISVVVPVFQEAETIVTVLQRLVETLERRFQRFEILVVADGCTDGTVQEAQKLERAEVLLFSYQPNRGKGYALKLGTSHARAPLIVFCDGDLDIHPESIIALFEIMELEKADVVTGSKLHINSKVEYPIYRKIQSAVFRSIIGLMFEVPVRDTQTGLKLFRKDSLLQVIDKVESNGFSFDLELLARLAPRNTIVEGPVWLTYDFKSSVGLRVPFVMLRDAVRIYKRLRRENV